MAPDEPNVHVILSTVDDESKARALARLWVESRRAACVTVLPGTTSVYRWKGEVCEEGECLLLIKTAFATSAARDRLIAGFAGDHPYDEPEFVVLDPSGGAAGYLAWVKEQVAS